MNRDTCMCNCDEYLFFRLPFDFIQGGAFFCASVLFLEVVHNGIRLTLCRNNSDCLRRSRNWKRQIDEWLEILRGTSTFKAVNCVYQKTTENGLQKRVMRLFLVSVNLRAKVRLHTLEIKKKKNICAI